jgi:hypothetical protein
MDMHYALPCSQQQQCRLMRLQGVRNSSSLRAVEALSTCAPRASTAGALVRDESPAARWAVRVRH